MDDSNRKKKKSGKITSDTISNKKYDFKCEDIESKLNQNNKLLDAIRDIQSEFIINEDAHYLFNKLLITLLEITKSEYGLIGEVLYNQNKEPVLITKAISSFFKTKNKTHDTQKNQEIEFRDLNIPFGRVVNTGKPVFFNESENYYKVKGLPDGHPVIHSFAGLPFKTGDSLVGMIGIANCPEGYTEDLYSFLEPFLNTCANLIVGIRNNDKRKKAEKELINSQKELAFVFENNPSLMVLLDSKLNILKTNAKVNSTFKCFQDDIIGQQPGDALKCLYSLDHPDGCGAGAHCKTCTLRSTVLNSLNSGTNQYNIETFLTIGSKKKNNELYINLCTTYLALDDENYVLVCIQDITKRKQAEDALRKNEEEARLINRKLNTFINSIPDLAWFKDKKSNFIIVNKAFGDAVGMDPEFLVNNSCEICFGKEAAEKFKEDDRKVMKGEKQIVIEESIIDANGNKIYLETIKSPFWDESGQVIGTIGVARNINDRKKAEMELAEERSRLDFIISGTNVGTWEWNVQTGETIFNERWAEIIGYTLEAISPVTIDKWIKFVHPDDLNLSNELLQKHFNGELDYYECEARMKHKNGNWVWVFDRGKVATWTESGEPLLMSGTHLEITERKQNEELLKLQKEIGIMLSSESNLETALQNILNQTLEINIYDSGGIYLVDEITGDLHLFANKGLSDEFVEQSKKLPISSPQVKLVKKGKPVYSNYNDLIKNYSDKDKQVRNNEGLLGIAVIPIFYQNNLIAAYNLASHTQNEISESSKAIIEAIASQIGIAIARIRAETAVRESQKNFQELFNSINDFLFILDENGNTIYYNPVVKNRLGYPDEELINKHVLEFHHPDRRDEAARIVQEMLQGKTESCPIPLMKKNGDQIPVDTKVTLGKWNGKNVIFGVSRDIRERVKMEDELKHRMRLEHLIANISTSFIKLSSEQIDSGIENALQAIAEYFDIDRSYVFLYNEDGSKFSNTHEWCKENIEPQIDNLKNLSVDIFPWAIKKLKNNESIDIENLKVIPSQGKNFKKSLEEQNIKSLLLVPMSYKNKPFGFLGIDSVLKQRIWSPESITLLKLVGEMFVNSLRRKYAEEKINLALKEKEILLSEIHHRVKNNMQVISSLLILQARRIQDLNYKQMFKESITRIGAMAFIHETLYESEDFSHININKYLKKICLNLSNLYLAGKNRIKININVHDVFMNMKSAIPCGLIVNELISNSLKHGFPDNRSGIIDITITEKNSKDIIINISDDGVGISPKFDWKHTKSLGLRIVSILVNEQLKGEINLLRKKRTEFIISFKKD